MILALLLLLGGVDWTAIVPTVEAAVARLESQVGDSKGICTAVIVDVDKDGYAAALTAAHCVKKDPNQRLDLTVSGRSAYVVDSNALLDLAIVRYRARKGDRAIPIAKDAPAKGSEVMVVGYPFGAEDLAEQFGHVAQHNRETKTTWINADLIFGNSGGAAVNGAGELVGINSAIVSQGPAHLGVLVTLDQVVDYLDFYRARYVRQLRGAGYASAIGVAPAHCPTCLTDDPQWSPYVLKDQRFLRAIWISPV